MSNARDAGVPPTDARRRPRREKCARRALRAEPLDSLDLIGDSQVTSRGARVTSRDSQVTPSAALVTSCEAPGEPRGARASASGDDGRRCGHRDDLRDDRRRRRGAGTRARERSLDDEDGESSRSKEVVSSRCHDEERLCIGRAAISSTRGVERALNPRRFRYDIRVAPGARRGNSRTRVASVWVGGHHCLVWRQALWVGCGVHRGVGDATAHPG